MNNLKPASKNAVLGYDPTSETMQHDSVFSQVAPGSASSGNLAHKWAPGLDHTRLSAPPDKLQGE